MSENEYANLALAEAISMEVPERELVEQSEFEGILKEFETLLSDGKSCSSNASILAPMVSGSISRTSLRS